MKQFLFISVLSTTKETTICHFVIIPTNNKDTIP